MPFDEQTRVYLHDCGEALASGIGVEAGGGAPRVCAPWRLPELRREHLDGVGLLLPAGALTCARPPGYERSRQGRARPPMRCGGSTTVLACPVSSTCSATSARRCATSSWWSIGCGVGGSGGRRHPRPGRRGSPAAGGSGALQADQRVDASVPAGRSRPLQGDRRSRARQGGVPRDPGLRLRRCLRRAPDLRPRRGVLSAARQRQPSLRGEREPARTSPGHPGDSGLRLRPHSLRAGALHRRVTSVERDPACVAISASGSGRISIAARSSPARARMHPAGAAAEHSRIPTESLPHLCGIAANLVCMELTRRVLEIGDPTESRLVEYCGYTHRTTVTPLRRRAECPMDHTRLQLEPRTRDLGKSAPRELLARSRLRRRGSMPRHADGRGPLLHQSRRLQLRSASLPRPLLSDRQCGRRLSALRRTAVAASASHATRRYP